MTGWTEIGFTTDGATYRDPQPGDDRVFRVYPSERLLRAEAAAAARALMRLAELAK